MHDTVTKLLDEMRQLWMAIPFTNCPYDLGASNIAPNPAPAADKIMAWRPPENNESSPLVHAVQQSAFLAMLNILSKTQYFRFYPMFLHQNHSHHAAHAIACWDRH